MDPVHMMMLRRTISRMIQDAASSKFDIEKKGNEILSFVEGTITRAKNDVAKINAAATAIKNDLK